MYWVNLSFHDVIMMSSWNRERKSLTVMTANAIAFPSCDAGVHYNYGCVVVSVPGQSASSCWVLYSLNWSACCIVCIYWWTHSLWISFQVLVASQRYWLIALPFWDSCQVVGLWYPCRLMVVWFMECWEVLRQAGRHCGTKER